MVEFLESVVQRSDKFLIAIFKLCKRVILYFNVPYLKGVDLSFRLIYAHIQKPQTKNSILYYCL